MELSSGRGARSSGLPVLIWWLLAASDLVPRVSIGSYTFGFEDVVAIIALPIVAAWLYKGAYRGVWKLRTLSTAWFLIITAGILFGVMNSSMLLDRLTFPSEMWQYVKRMVYFALAIRFVHSQWITPNKGARVLLYVFVAMTVIGLLQINSPIAEPLSALYSRTDVQLQALVDRSAAQARNYSVTGFSTSWGGLSAFIFFFALSVFAFDHRQRSTNLLRQIVPGALTVASLLNVLFSGSRAALLAVAAVFPLFMFLLATGPRRLSKRIKYISILVIAVVACAYGATVFLAGRLSFLEYRNEALVSAYYQGTNRFAEVRTAMAGLDNAYWWLFGIGNAAQRNLYISYGVEVEPVYLLVNYGLLGLFLRYFILWLIVQRSLLLFREERHLSSSARSLGAAGFLTVPAYLVFSVGYFFFQEPVVGTVPWLLFGLIVGLPHPYWAKVFGRPADPAGSLPAGAIRAVSGSVRTA